MRPLVTVYITNYNYGPFIRQAIESVLNQSFQGFELIIIDDGSKDNSREIIEEYSHHHKIRIIYQQNKGLNVTNNIALRSATGKYIIRLDADDFFHADALRILAEKMESSQDLGLVFGNYYIINESGEIIAEEKRHNFEKDVKLFDQPAHGACTMIKTEFLRNVGGYNESYNCQDGYELWVKFVSHFKVSNVNDFIFYYRRHGNNLTGNENRILDTRAKINANFVQEMEYNTHAVAVIPVRGLDDDIALKKLGSKTFLERKIEQALDSKNIHKIIVTSPLEEIGKTLPSDQRIKFHHRKEAEARYNRSLDPTLVEIVKKEDQFGLEFDTVVLLTVEYPFIQSYKIDDAINTLHLFGSDTLIGVRPDNSIFYQHHGDGLHPIMNREKYTKLEREALFKQVGGITVTRKSSLIKHQKLMYGTLGHIVLDQKNAIGVFSKFDLQLARILHASEEKEIDRAMK